MNKSDNIKTIIIQTRKLKAFNRDTIPRKIMLLASMNTFSYLPI